MPTICQVLYISYFIDSFLVDLSALTVSIHKVSGAQRGQGHSVKVAELVKCRTGPIFPGYCLVVVPSFGSLPHTLTPSSVREEGIVK